ncbi:hypothetical protein OROMI_021083 [Orobanche minor]
MESSKKQRKHNTSDISIQDLPLCIVGLIFLKLPVVALLQCMRVCKVWQAYISDPEFGMVYSKESHFVKVILYSMHHDSCLAEVKADNCVTNTTRVIKNWIPSPPPVKGKNVKYQAFLFGFNQKANDYKVLRIFTRRQNPGITEAQIITIATDMEWRPILNQPIPIPLPQEAEEFFFNSYVCGVTFNGALHWITKGTVMDHFLVSFDIAEETIRPFPHPERIDVEDNTVLGVLRDCLCIFQYFSSDSQLDIWTMNKYGVAESWTKEKIRFSTRLPLMPLISLGINEFLRFKLDGTLTAYNYQKQKEATVVFTSGFGVRCAFAVPYVPCFLSFENLMKGSGGQLKFVKKSINSICFTRSGG